MMDKMHKLGLSLVLLTALSACSTVKDWMQKEKLYEEPAAELIEFTAEFTPVELWSIDTGGGSEAYSEIALWLQGDMAVAVDYEGDVSAYNAKTGRRLWDTSLDVPVATGAGGGEGLIFIGSQKGEIFALNESDGSLIWKQQLTSEVLASPKAIKGVVIARTTDGGMRGLSVADGATLWSYQRAVPLLSLRGASSAVLAGDKVIAGYANGKLVVLSVIDGQVIWEKSVAVPKGRSELDRLVDIDSDPVIKDGIVYVVAYHGQAAAFDLENGQKLWERDMSSRSGLDVADKLYLSDDAGYVWALQTDSGYALWRQTSLLRRKVTAPAIVGEQILVGDFEGYVHWISRDDGRLVARAKISKSAIKGKPVVKDNIVYILASDGELTAFRVQ